MSARLIVVLLVLASSVGCSVQMAYNNLDRLARWSVSDYVDMNDRQRDYFDAAIADVWYWHRREHLPRYADFLETVGPALVDGTDETEMQAIVDRVFDWAQDIQDRSVPVAANFLASLDDAQIAELAENLESRNEEIAEPEAGVALAESQVQWREEFEDRFTQFSGRLTGVQRAYLEQRARDYRPELVLWADYRRRWQADFLALLAFREDVDGLARGLAELADHRERYYGSVLAEVFEANVDLNREASVWLINSLTERQQTRFVERLNELAEDFRELAADGVPAPAEPPCLVTC
jgi:hypothetical protein